MKTNFEKSLKLVLNHEGGFADDPDDPGGATNKGITLRTFRAAYPHSTLEDLETIGDNQVQQIYKKDYWDLIGGDTLPLGVDYAVFDFAVNSGVTLATSMYKRARAEKPDMSAEELIRSICARRRLYLNDLIITKPKLKKFERGWGKRVDDVYRAAIMMAQNSRATGAVSVMA